MRSVTTYGAGVLATSSAHLALIPILAWYGLSVCPVLRSHGFGLGCVYNGTFVAWIIVSNALGLLVTLRLLRRPAGAVRGIAAALYAGAFFAGTLALLGYLRHLHVPSPTGVKMGTALFYSGVLLGVLHLQIVEWMTTVWMRSKAVDPTEIHPPEGKRPAWLLLSWAKGMAWEFLPDAGALAIFIVFAARVNESFMGEGEMSAAMIASSWRELLRVGLLLAGWLLAIRAFRLLVEKRLLEDVKTHLDALSRLESSRFSREEAPGFWSHIFAGLNQASGILTQRARLIRGFSAYVAQDVVSQVLGSDVLKPEGKSCTLTILTSDLRDFTRLSNSMSAEKIVRTLNVYFADMIDVFVANDVHLDKFIGDGILAYIQPSGGDLAESNARGVRVALAMHEKLLNETNPKLEQEGLPPLKLGVGVHAGNLVLGNIGAAMKMQYTIIGDAVNIASRLESFCKVLGVGVIVSREVHETLPAELRSAFSDQGEQEVRGIQKKLRLFGALPARGVESQSA